MTTVERRKRNRSRIKSLKMKINPLSPHITEAERIIKRDGFNYFLISNE